MFNNEIIEKLQAIRRKTFSTYNDIVLDKDAIKIFARLFINPDCQADIDIFSLENEEVKLSYLGDHIITAGPSTIAKYAEKNKLIKLGKKDMLKCFALDHAHDVNENRVAEEKNPFYAYAHILHSSKVYSLKKIEGNNVAELSTITSWGNISFKNVLVPFDMEIKKGDSVYHHFGVIVSESDDKKFSELLYALQEKHEFITKLKRESAQKNIVIDFSDTTMFHKDVLGQILKPQKASIIKNPGDLDKGKIKFQN